MYSVILMLLENSIFAAVLFAGILLIKKIFRRKISANMHYLLWGIVVLKLILPMQLSTEISPWNLLPRQYDAVQAVTLPLSLNTAEEASMEEKAQVLIDVSETHAKEDMAKNAEVRSAVPEKSYQVKWQDIISAVWVFGMASMVFWLAMGIMRLKKNAKNAYPMPEWAEALFEDCKAELNIKKDIRLSVEKIRVPAVRGVFRSVVMLPVQLAEKEDRQGTRLIMFHELKHIVRCDIMAAYILNIINVIYWFNPIVWLLVRFINTDIETACDASVLRVLGLENRQPYIKTLVRFAGNRAEKIMQPLLCLSDSGVNMKRRIEAMFLDKKTKQPVKTVVTLIVCLLAAVCFTSACQSAAESGTEGNKMAVSESVSSPISTATGSRASHYTAPAAIKSDYNVTVNFDADVDVPDVTKYPVYTIDTKTGFSEGETQKIRNYFLKGNDNHTAWARNYEFLRADGSKSRLTFSSSQIHYDSNTLNKTEYSFMDEEQPKGVKMTKDEAIKAAQGILGAIGIENTELYKVCIENVAQDKSETKETQCWTLKYYRTFGGIALSNFNGAPYVDLIDTHNDNEMYYKTGRSEIISISLDDNDLLEFDWSNPVAITGTAEENVSLISLDDIMDIARSKMYYKAEAESDAGVVSYYDAVVKIKSIKLSYNIVKSNDDESHYLIIPVWNFVGEVDASNTIDFTMDEGFSFLSVDAVHGSIINSYS